MEVRPHDRTASNKRSEENLVKPKSGAPDHVPSRNSRKSAETSCDKTQRLVDVPGLFRRNIGPFLPAAVAHCRQWGHVRRVVSRLRVRDPYLPGIPCLQG